VIGEGCGIWVEAGRHFDLAPEELDDTSTAAAEVEDATVRGQAAADSGFQLVAARAPVRPHGTVARAVRVLEGEREQRLWRHRVGGGSDAHAGGILSNLSPSWHGSLNSTRIGDNEVMAKGDFVEVLVDSGGGSSREYRIEATRAGRTVEVRSSRTTVEVRELTRTGGVVRTARFIAPRVLAVVEHPNGEARKKAA
jgi:hypothetical protein